MRKEHVFIPKGVCATQITFEIEDGNNDISNITKTYTTRSKGYRTEGYLVYNINLTDGLQSKGFIEHETDVKRYSGTNLIRGLYIKDNLFTVSQGMIKVNKIDTLEEISSVLVKEEE